nr:hydantoinase B/oxoprolinase family protein [Gammaproteobacteria bacterium]
EILWTRLVSVVDEAALTLHRTSFSTVVRESHDYTCMLIDAEGRAVVQATRSVPSFTGTLPHSVRAFLARYPKDTLAPGDFIISNDPWLGTGHLPDLTGAMPLFHDGSLVGFAGAIAHMPDIGGRRRAPDNKDLYEEGLQIPILKLYERGELNQTLMAMIQQNVRVPTEVSGDMHAMRGACQAMGRGLGDVLREYQQGNLKPIADEIISRSESAMRASIAAVPNGHYKSVTPIDSFDTAKPLEIHCALTVEDDNIHVDFSGSSAQNASPLNAVLGYTRAYSIYALKCILLPNVPNNEGDTLPFAFTAPKGCFLNPRYPAAVEARATVGHYATSAIFNSLALAIPEQVPAESGIPLHGFALRGVHNGKPRAGIFFFNGGFGARTNAHGIGALSFPTNVSNTPVEVLERSFPVRFHEKSLLAGSGGAGKFHGGDGQRISMEIVGDEAVNIVLLSQRLKYPALGREGGEPGRPERIFLNDEPVEGQTPFNLRDGDTFTLELPGGGGYGSPNNAPTDD